MTETAKRYTPRICPKCGTRDSCVIPAPGLDYYVCARERGGCGFASEDLVNREEREQDRRWQALEASVPCAHSIPGTCDRC